MLRASATRCICPPLSMLAPRSDTPLKPDQLQGTRDPLADQLAARPSRSSGNATFSNTVLCGQMA